MRAEKDKILEGLINSMSELVDSIAVRPEMYVGKGDLVSAESLVFIILSLRSQALNKSVSKREVSKFLAGKYPKIPGPIRTITAGAVFAHNDWTSEMKEFIDWYQSAEKDL